MKQQMASSYLFSILWGSEGKDLLNFMTNTSTGVATDARYERCSAVGVATVI